VAIDPPLDFPAGADLAAQDGACDSVGQSAPNRSSRL